MRLIKIHLRLSTDLQPNNSGVIFVGFNLDHEIRYCIASCYLKVSGNKTQMFAKMTVL
jgi:hypothetical protein